MLNSKTVFGRSDAGNDASLSLLMDLSMNESGIAVVLSLTERITPEKDEFVDTLPTF